MQWNTASLYGLKWKFNQEDFILKSFAHTLSFSNQLSYTSWLVFINFPAPPFVSQFKNRGATPSWFVSSSQLETVHSVCFNYSGTNTKLFQSTIYFFTSIACVACCLSEANIQHFYVNVSTIICKTAAKVLSWLQWSNNVAFRRCRKGNSHIPCILLLPPALLHCY